MPAEIPAEVRVLLQEAADLLTGQGGGTPGVRVARAYACGVQIRLLLARLAPPCAECKTQTLCGHFGCWPE